jgi:viroplasmin and RNaseH domain-containing protein
MVLVPTHEMYVNGYGGAQYLGIEEYEEEEEGSDEGHSSSENTGKHEGSYEH